MLAPPRLTIALPSIYDVVNERTSDHDREK